LGGLWFTKLVSVLDLLSIPILLCISFRNWPQNYAN
jgi:hypothetical protein